MTVLVSIDGRIVPPEEALVPVFDRGFLYGDSVYEVVRTYGAVPFALDEHLERLERSAALLGIELPRKREHIRAEILDLVGRADHGDSYLRIIVTRGTGEIDLDPGAARDPRSVVIMQPLRPLPRDLADKGASVLVVASGRFPGGAIPDGSKTGNYLGNLMALGRAKRKGYHEAVLLSAAGMVAEGASSNIFIVRGGSVETPALSAGILAGITRSIVIEEARRASIGVRESLLGHGDLLGADEAFLTSTLRDVLPVVRVDDTILGAGSPGPVTLRVREAYLAHVRGRIARDRRA